MKILNLYAGIGGNRKLWGDEHEITAVEFDPAIAKIYKDFHPNDTVVVGDAHAYLQEHFSEFDFIWSSPPCPTHSRMNVFNWSKSGKPKFPDMKLYEEIIFLDKWFKGKYVVENVKSYYKPLIKPQESKRHYFWANFDIPEIEHTSYGASNKNKSRLADKMEERGIFIKDFYGYKGDKRTLLHNAIEGELGIGILEASIKQLKEELKGGE